MALISRLPSGGGSTGSRSTKIHTGSVRCANKTENTVFEFVGGGKVNQMKLEQSTSMGTDAYLAIIVDGTELHRYSNTTVGSADFYFVRYNNGNLSFTTSVPEHVLPLDIEFKNELKIIAYAANNTPTINYSMEISES